MNLLVTGGTRGLGLVVVQQQLQAGHHVWAVGRKASAGLAKLQAEFGDRCQFVPLDLSHSSQAVRQALQQGLDKVALDAVVNNAAIAYEGLVSHLDIADVEKLFRVNVFSAMEVGRFAVRNMLLHRRRGSLVFVSSVTTTVGSKGLSFYAATKGAIEAFSLNLAQEWGSRGIRSNCVVPGFMETDMSAGLSDAQRQGIARRSALRQLVDVASVASTIGFLISNAAGSVTGQCWSVDAGAR